jgi:release factor glutamine methyltransferase
VRKLAKGRVLDVGTGSGIQALSAERAESVLGVDIDEDVIARCKRLETGRVRFAVSDLFSNVSGKFDTIIFNAPYLPSDKGIEDRTLYGGSEGHEIIERFLKEAGTFLADDGIILLVFSSFTVKDKVDSLIEENGFDFEELEKVHISFEDIYCYRLTKGNFK